MIPGAAPAGHPCHGNRRTPAICATFSPDSVENVAQIGDGREFRRADRGRGASSVEQIETADGWEAAGGRC